MEVFLVLAGLVVLANLVGWVARNAQAAKLYNALKPKLDNLEAREAAFKNQQNEWTRRVDADNQARETAFKNREDEWSRKVDADKQAIETLAREKSTGFPWLAEAYADYLHLQDLKTAQDLRRKSHPALKSAERVREIAQQRHDAEKAWRVLKYQLAYYEDLFPFLIDFKEEDIDDLIRQLTNGTLRSESNVEEEEGVDPVRHWLTSAEYDRLPSAARNQLALDRYWKRKKSPRELGRDYERFVGYEHEVKGCRVYYQGIIEGFADLGRDLVVEYPAGEVEIIQCKYWSKDKVIHEKHIFQLYGTLIAYRIDHPQSRVSGTFVTSTILSDRAKQFAVALGIRSVEGHSLGDYPCIKCNISQRDGERIYHLPFDQQYDKTLIGHRDQERYAATVAEAERLGFRRAFRWHPVAAE